MFVFSIFAVAELVQEWCLKDEFLVLFRFSSIQFWFSQGPFLGRGMGRGRALAPPPGLQALSWGGCCKADWMLILSLVGTCSLQLKLED